MPPMSCRHGMRMGINATAQSLLPVRLGPLRAIQGGDEDRCTAPHERQERSISVLHSAQQIDWRGYVPSSVARLGGTLVVSDAENKEVVQRAHGDGSLSFGFSAGGTLFPYYIGSCAALVDAGILTENTKVAGASAGSLIAACIKAGVPLEHITEQCLRLMADCRANGTQGRLGPVLERFLQDHLPADAHVRCEGRTFVAVTQAYPYIQPKLLSTFADRDDLIRALMTSCHVPYWLDGKLFTPFHDQPHLDGGLTNFIPLAPGTVGVRVCCFPAKQLSPVYRIGIAPDLYSQWPHSLRQTVSWALEPADENTVLFLIDQGKRDAQAWMEAMGLREGGKEAAAAGQVAAAKSVAAGTEDGSVQEERQQRGEAALKQRCADEAAGARA